MSILSRGGIRGLLHFQILLGLGATLSVWGLTGCEYQTSGSHTDAVEDLRAAFQSGCSIDGTLTEVALGQTASLKVTLQNLKQNNRCAGLDSALNTIQNLNQELAGLAADPLTFQLKSMEEGQKLLLLQISQTNDPQLLSLLTQSYSSNAVEMATVQGQQFSLTGNPYTTRLQRGYSQVNSYLGALMSDTSSLTDCARDNPLFGAQLGASLMAVSGTFADPKTGMALSLAGNILNQLLSFVRDQDFSGAINQLNLVGMSNALSCGLESMANVYCGAKELITLTHLQECSYHPGASADCPEALKGTQDRGSVKLTEFWRGVDILSRELPMFQLWIRKVVSGVTPADVYDAGRQNDPVQAQAVMDQIKRLVQGWESQQTQIIGRFQTDAEKHVAVVRALSGLVNLLSTGNASQSTCVMGGCTSTPIVNYYQSSSAVLYALVGQPLNCVSSAFGGSCQDANTILLPGDSIPLDPVTHQPLPRVNGNGGWATILANEGMLFNTVYGQVNEQRHQALDVDPSGILESAKISEVMGYVDAFTAMKNISSYLENSHKYLKNLSVNFVKGGEEGRAGALRLLEDTQQMIDEVTFKVITIKGKAKEDEQTLVEIFNLLRLGQDPNFIDQRITLHIKDDLNLRINSGDAPNSVEEILQAGAASAATQLAGISSSDIDRMYANLGNAQNISRLNSETFVQFFSKALSDALTLLKTSADQDGEPLGGNPRTAPFRASQARLCILIASSRADWPAEVDPALCRGVYYASDLTGDMISFDELFKQMSGEKRAVSNRICTFNDFYVKSAKWSRQGKGTR